MEAINNNIEYKKIEFLQTDLLKLRENLENLEYYGLDFGKKFSKKLDAKIDKLFNLRYQYDKKIIQTINKS